MTHMNLRILLFSPLAAAILSAFVPVPATAAVTVDAGNATVRTGLQTGATVFTDRTYTYGEIPPLLVGADYVQTPNNDKTNAGYSLSLSFADTPYLVVLLFDSRLGSGVAEQENPPTPPDLAAAGMDWVGAAGFAATNHIIGIAESSGVRPAYAYTKTVAAGTAIDFFQQNDQSGYEGSRSMYTILAMPILDPHYLLPWEPVAADADGSVRIITVPVKNIGATRDLVVTGAQATGAQAALFTVDSAQFPFAIGPDTEGDILIRLDPGDYTGPVRATLEVECNHGGTPGTVVRIPIEGTAQARPPRRVGFFVSGYDEAAGILHCTATNLEEGKTYFIGGSTDLKTFRPLGEAYDFDSTTPQPMAVPVPRSESSFFLRVYSGSTRDWLSSTPPVCPRWALEPWIWEDNGNDRASVFSIVDGYLDRDIPTGVVMIDSPWEPAYNDMVWDEIHYPDPRDMIDQLKAKGLRIVVWITGIMNDTSKDSPVDKSIHYDDVVANHYGVNNDTPFTWWKGHGIHIDFTRQDAADWFGDLMAGMMDMGVDGWKVDQSAEVIPGDTVNTSIGVIPKQQFKAAYYAALHDQALKHNPEALILARPYSWQGGYACGVSKCTLGWCGDFKGDFDGLRLQMDNLYRSAQTGYGALAVEVGGYHRVNPTKNSLIRYAQFGALMPGMENGGVNGGLSAHLPWHWDEETVDIYRYYAVLHSELAPYIFSCSVESHLTGKPVVRDSDIAAACHRLGPAIFAAPVVTDGTSVEKSVTLPASGHWIDYWDEDSLLAPGAKFTVQVPLDRIPVYLRAGAIIPMHVTRDLTGHGDATSANRETVIVYPYGRSSFLYHRPSGSGVAYDDVRIKMDEKSGSLSVSGSSSLPWRLRVKSFSAPSSVEGADAWSYDEDAKWVVIDKQGAEFTVRIEGLGGYSGK